MNVYFITSFFMFSLYTLFPADNKVLCHPFMEESKARRVVENIEHAELQELPETIRNNNPLVSYPYRTVVLYGEPGTGKTTIMEAVATLVGTEWGATFISKKDLNAEPGKRGATMKAFCDVLKASQRQHEKNMILMSEFHGFLNHFNSENHDTDEFSTAFQDILDENEKTHNMFFIATVNDFDKVAKPIKDRLQGSMFKITGFGNQEAANAEFFEQIDSRNYILSEQDRDCLRMRYEEMRAKPRDTKIWTDRICLRAHRFRDKKTNVSTINVAIIDHVLDQRAQTHVDIKFNEVVLSDQERMHKESFDQNERHFEENKKINADEREKDRALHKKERDEDNLRADYNAFLSTISAYAATDRGTKIYSCQRKSDYSGGIPYKLLLNGMQYTTDALEMREEEIRPSLERIQQNQVVAQGSGCSIQ